MPTYDSIDDYNFTAAEINLDAVESFKVIKELAQKYAGSQDKTVLDIGCGIGYVSNYLSGVGKTTGIDINVEGVKKAKELYPHVEFIEHDITLGEENTLGKKFDVIVLNNIVEHLQDENRERLFRKLKNSLLTDTGVIIFGYANPYHPVQLVWSFFIQKGLWDKTHVHNWNAKEWKKVVQHDFDIIEEKRTSPFTKMIWIGKHFKVDEVYVCKPKA